MLDAVVVTQSKTLPLFKVFYESYQCHFKASGRLLVFSEAETIDQLQKWNWAPNVELFRIDDFLPNPAQYEGYKIPQYIKLSTPELIQSSHFLILDDDFLFIRPTDERNFFFQEKPFWFYETWERTGSGKRWREPMQKFFGIDPPYCFLTNSTFLLDTSIVRDLKARYPLKTLFDYPEFGDCQAYATFAHAYFKDHYHWINNYWGDEVLLRRVNQVPPSYQSLDPTIRFSDFQHFHNLAFWSHWSECERTMKEFLEASKWNQK